MPPPPKKGSQSRMKTVLIIVGAVAMVALVIGGIIWSQRGLVTVQTGKVNRQDITAIVTASGQIMPPPDDYANVNANSVGKVTEIYVKEGDRVKKGQLLLRTENIQQTADVNAQVAAVNTENADISAGQATVESAQASLKTSEANVAQAQAKYQQAKDDFGRNQEAFKEQLIARQVFDQSRSDYQVAEASLHSAQAQVSQQKALLQQATFNRDMAKARLAQNKAQLTRYQDLLNKTVYTSPFDGIITSLPVHVGENVVPGIQNAAGSTLFQVSDLAIITAEVDVDETDIINVKMGQSADVTIDAIPNKVFKGKVTQIGMTAIDQNTGQATTSSSSSSTGTSAKDFQVVVTLDDPPPNMRPGLSATAKITTATRQNVLAIPIQALTIREKGELEMEQKKASGVAMAATAQDSGTSSTNKSKEEIQGVFVVRNGHAIFVPVKSGIMGTTNVEVLDGLKQGDEIVTGSYQILRTLKTDTKVKIDNTTKLGPPSSSTSS